MESEQHEVTGQDAEELWRQAHNFCAQFDQLFGAMFSLRNWLAKAKEALSAVEPRVEVLKQEVQELTYRKDGLLTEMAQHTTARANQLSTLQAELDGLKENRTAELQEILDDLKARIVTTQASLDELTSRAEEAATSFGTIKAERIKELNDLNTQVAQGVSTIKRSMVLHRWETSKATSPASSVDAHSR